MKGKNTLKLNTATMHEAAQMWVDSALASKPRVVAVRQYPEQGGYAGTPAAPGYYEIDVDDGEKDEKKQPSPPGDGER